MTRGYEIVLHLCAVEPWQDLITGIAVALRQQSARMPAYYVHGTPALSAVPLLVSPTIPLTTAPVPRAAIMASATSWPLSGQKPLSTGGQRQSRTHALTIVANRVIKSQVL